jgi:hypothetical protein
MAINVTLHRLLEIFVLLLPSHENLCQLYIRQGTDTQDRLELKKLNSPKINNPMKKWANEMSRTF